jgi:hypothetical protein
LIGVDAREIASYLGSTAFLVPRSPERRSAMKIIVSGPAAAFDSDDNQITDAAELKKLDGLVAGDGELCSEFLDGELDEIGLTGGAVKIVYDPAANRLRVVSEYHCHRNLTEHELRLLANATRGQWSDGIGAGGFLDYAEQTGISVDPYPRESGKGNVSIEQIEDAVKTAPPKRTSPLFKAVEAGDIDKIKKLLAKGEDINCRNKYQWTPLISAIRSRQTEAALFLIEQGADVKLQARWGPRGEPPELESAIIWSAMQGDLRVLRLLIAAGADVNTRDGEGMTPAMFAANRGFIELLQTLIDAGCNLNQQDNQGRTALMLTGPDHFDILELLLKSGANPRIRNNEGRTAAEHALSQPATWRKTAEFLRQHEG